MRHKRTKKKSVETFFSMIANHNFFDGLPRNETILMPAFPLTVVKAIKLVRERE